MSVDGVHVQKLKAENAKLMQEKKELEHQLETRTNAEEERILHRRLKNKLLEADRRIKKHFAA